MALLLLLFVDNPCALLAESSPPSPEVPLPVVTNAAAVQRLAVQGQNALCRLRLEGTVLWASPGQDQFLFQSDAGCLPVEMDLRAQPMLVQGQRVRLEGSAVAGGGRLRAFLLDNDGLHSALERSETVSLPAGRLPLRVEWFNAPADYVLAVDYAPPGAPRQHIPEDVLWRVERPPGTAGLHWQQGLDYRCFEGNWALLPEFDALTPVKSGTTTNFSLGVRSRDVQVGLQWRGYLEVRQAGVYTFWLRSDDGSRLELGGASLRVSPGEVQPPPKARPVVLGESVQDGEWIQLEGVLTGMHHCPSGGTEAEVSLGTNRVDVEVSEESGTAPERFSRVRVRGVGRTLCPGRGAVGRVLVQSWQGIESLGAPAATVGRPLTRVAEVRELSSKGERVLCDLELHGLILAASPERGWVVLQDDSGAALIQLAGEHPALRAGQTVVVAGAAAVEGLRVEMEPAAVVEHDRVHSLSEKSGSVYLHAGKHPLHLSWFNFNGGAGLEVNYAGPGVPRQKVPAAALFHAEPPAGGGVVQWAPGLSYSAYEGLWTRLPDPGLLLPSREGVAPTFDPTRATRSRGVALEFSGWLEVPRDGVYTFWVRSADGSRLFVGEAAPRVEVTGAGAVPAPSHLVPCQTLQEGQASPWSQVEGTVVFASEQPEGLALDLSSATGPMRVFVADPVGSAPRLLLNSRIRATGLPQLTYTTDDQPVAGVLWAPGRQQLQLVHLAAERWTEYPLLPIPELLRSNAPAPLGAIVHVRGRLRAAGPEGALEVEQDGQRVTLECALGVLPADGTEVEALGQWARTDQGGKLLGGCYRVLAPQPNAALKPLPLLTTVEQVKSLSREEAERGYPVKLRGILTAPLVGGFFMQDSTWAIYVGWDEGTNVTLHAGDYWEVEGKTFAEFAPNVLARRAVRLGPGVLPAPLRPTWDQLINGSLDTRYVELQGVVTAVEGAALSLLTRAGKIHLELPEAAPGGLRQYENALIRVRGCLMPGRNAQTQEVEFGRVQLLNYSLMVDEPAPTDPFAATLKRAADLLMFDSRAGAIHRVKVFGQVVQAHRGEFYLVEGGCGLRFVPKTPVDLRPGDLVEVAGFPFLGGPSPVLREAVARRTGHAALPTAQLLSEEDLLNPQHEANLVRVEARLVNVSLNRSEQVLELQTASRGFLARLEAPNGWRPELLPGSRLELTGVYAGQGGDTAASRGLDTFELLLNSPADIRVLARPSWWSLQHTLTVVGGMALVLVAALIWISLLRRQVEERSRQLAVAIRRQEHAESQRQLEAERARVARDLHDDLGAALTEIGLLGALAQRLNTAPERVRDHLGHITEKAREMVTTLDEIVWSLNPKHDSVASLSKYFCEYAQQFLQLTAVRCRLEVPEHLPDFPLSSDQRHHLLLAFKEALTNVVRHAQASETHIGIEVQDGVLVVTVSDDGRGLDLNSRSHGADGLDNLARRLQQLGGSCEVSSQAGQGTRVRMLLPVSNPTALGSSR